MFTISIARIIVGCWCGAWYLPEPEGGGAQVDGIIVCCGSAAQLCTGRRHLHAARTQYYQGRPVRAFVKGGGHWESHRAGQTLMISSTPCKSGCLITSEWISSGRFAWVGQQGCQATRRAPQIVASISAAASSVDRAMYLRQTVGSCSCSCNSVKLVLVRESMSQCDG